MIRLRHLAPIAAVAAVLLCGLAVGAPPAGLIEPGATPTQVGEGFTFTEGPAADADGNVYFTDVRASRIHKWSTDG